MSSMTRRDYWKEMNPMREPVNSFFDEIFTRLPGFSGLGEWKPSIDLIDKDTDYVLMADLPGYTPENIKISVQENGIHLKGKVQEEKEATQGDFQVKERSFGTFSRSIPLPAQIKTEEARAKFKNGVLEITLPKVEAPTGHILDIETE